MQQPAASQNLRTPLFLPHASTTESRLHREFIGSSTSGAASSARRDAELRPCCERSFPRGAPAATPP